jgi:hypothetical protein
VSVTVPSYQEDNGGVIYYTYNLNNRAANSVCTNGRGKRKRSIQDTRKVRGYGFSLAMLYGHLLV